MVSTLVSASVFLFACGVKKYLTWGFVVSVSVFAQIVGVKLISIDLAQELYLVIIRSYLVELIFN